MSKKPGDWWDKSWTLVEGCTWPKGEMPPACEKCWARGMAKRWNPDQVSGGVKTRPDRLDLPLKTRKPTVFACQINYGDLFHNDVPAEFIRRALWTVDFRRDHTFVLLTKRPLRAAMILSAWMKYRLDYNFGAEFPGILLASVWDQASTDAACAAFAGLPIRWGLHCEPMLGPVHLPFGLFDEYHETAGDPYLPAKTQPSWIVVGGETGPGARPLHPDWVRTIRDQCKAAGVPFWFKGWGALVPDMHAMKGGKIPGFLRVGKKRAGRLLDGVEHNATPWPDGT